LEKGGRAGPLSVGRFMAGLAARVKRPVAAPERGACGQATRAGSDGFETPVFDPTPGGSLAAPRQRWLGSLRDAVDPPSRVGLCTIAT